VAAESEPDAEPAPAQWVTYTICSQSFKIAGPTCPDTMELAFPAGAISDEVCTLEH
jgi:hypothetical protein